MAKERLLHFAASLGGEPDYDKGSVFFVGTATVIIEYAGFSILTDPNFLHAGDHAHIGYGLTTKRLTNPAMDIEDLPSLDFCILSHYHGDHFDQIVEQRLDKDLPIITTAHAVKRLAEKGFRRLYALDVWDSITLSKGQARLKLTSMPGRHAPRPLSALLPPVMGSMLEFGKEGEPARMTIYISGDTLMIDELREIPRRYPDIALALIHLGGTKLLGIVTVTMDAKQGVEAVRLLKPHAAIPIHYNDYTVFKSPLDDFKRAMEKANLPTRIVYLSHGEAYGFMAPKRGG